MLGWDLEVVLLCFMFNETVSVWLPQNSFPKHSSYGLEREITTSLILPISTLLQPTGRMSACF